MSGKCVHGIDIGMAYTCVECNKQVFHSGELKGWVCISAPMIDPRWKEPSAIVLARDLWIEIEKKDADLARLREENARLRALLVEYQAKTFQYEAEKAEPGMLLREVKRLTALVEEAAGIIEHYYHPAMQKSDISIAMQDWLRMAGEGKGTPAPTIINQSGLKPLGTTGKYVDQMGDVYSKEGDR